MYIRKRTKLLQSCFLKGHIVAMNLQFNVAIIRAGAAGTFAAYHLYKTFDDCSACRAFVARWVRSIYVLLRAAC